MRKIGYALLAIGFLWWLLVDVSLREMAHAIVGFHLHQVSSQQPLTLEQVEPHIHNPVFELITRMPVLTFPGLIMLLGGLCLGSSVRRL